MKHLRGLLFSLTGSILLCSTALVAQQAAPRITQQVNDVSLAALKGSVPMIARPQFDRGEAPAEMQMTGVRLVFSRSAEQQAALTRYLAELQDPSSPNYHKWLTPDQFGKLYGPADSDIAAIVGWLQSHGLTVANIAPGRAGISFSGSVSQMEDAFHTQIHSFSVNGHQFYANATNPKIPAALANVVVGVARLNTIKARPQSKRGQMGRINPETKRLEPLNAFSTAFRPDLTIGSGTTDDPYNLYIVPGDAATIYNTPNTTFNANYTTGTSYTGSGVTIGVGGDAVIDTSIVQTYRNLFLGSSTVPTVTNPNGVTSTENSDEAYIDTELAGALAPAAAINYYIDSNDLGIEQMLSDNSVDIFSLSFGLCEQNLSTADNQLFYNWWQQAAAQGIAVVVSSGDSGSAGCDNPNSTNTANSGLAVNAFASTPYNIAVGGTDFYSLGSNFSTYATVPTGSSSSAGSSSTYYRTAKSYIPESTWNNSTVTNTTTSANAPWSSKGSDYTSYNNIVAGSGGPSNCSTNTTVDTSSTYTIGTCTSGYSKPVWQRGTGTHDTDGSRDIPDVSLFAGNGWDSAVWLVCDDETATGSSKQTVTLNCSSGYVDGFGGTSTATPAFAGILALVQQKTGSRLGQAAEQLYDLYNGSHASSVFHDTTVGNISVPCTSGTPNCVKNTAGYYFLSGYDTETGYDLATGMGSVNAANLVTYWGTATGPNTATIALTPTTITLNSGQSFTETVSVTGSGSTPTGTITLAAGTYSAAQTIGTSPCTSNTNCVFTVPGGVMPPGSNSITAYYSGDSTYAPSNNSASATVTQSFYTPTLTPASGSVTAGGSTTSTISLSSSDNYTGAVTFACSIESMPTGATGTMPTCSISPASITMNNGTAAGTALLTISTTASSNSASMVRPNLPAGKNSGLPGSGIAAGSSAILAILVFFGIPARRRNWRNMMGLVVLVAVFGGLSACGGGGGGSNSGGSTSKLTPVVTVSPAKATVTTANSLSVPVTVTGSGATPTGTIALSGGGYTSSSASLTSGSYTFVIPAGAFTSMGSVTLTASYGGDSNYYPATGTSTVTVSKAATTAGQYAIKVTGTGSDASHTTTSTLFTLTVN